MAELFAFYGLEMPEKLLLEADELTYNDYIRLQKIFNPKETGNATAMMRELRRIKTPYEIEMFRISAERHAKTYAEIPECFRPGMTDLEFQYEIENGCARTVPSDCSAPSELIWISLWEVSWREKTPKSPRLSTLP